MPTTTYAGHAQGFADKTGDENIQKMLLKIQEDRAAGRRDDALGIIGGN